MEHQQDLIFRTGKFHFFGIRKLDYHFESAVPPVSGIYHLRKDGFSVSVRSPSDGQGETWELFIRQDQGSLRPDTENVIAKFSSKEEAMKAFNAIGLSLHGRKWTPGKWWTWTKRGVVAAAFMVVVFVIYSLVMGSPSSKTADYQPSYRPSQAAQQYQPPSEAERAAPMPEPGVARSSEEVKRLMENLGSGKK